MIHIVDFPSDLDLENNFTTIEVDNMEGVHLSHTNVLLPTVGKCVKYELPKG